MSSALLNKLLDTLQISRRGFAKKIHYSEDTVRSWTRGRTPIPHDVSEWVEKLVDFLKKNPLPVKKEDHDAFPPK